MSLERNNIFEKLKAKISVKSTKNSKKSTKSSKRALKAPKKSTKQKGTEQPGNEEFRLVAGYSFLCLAAPLNNVKLNSCESDNAGRRNLELELRLPNPELSGIT